jgi:hypothetical protein
MISQFLFILFCFLNCINLSINTNNDINLYKLLNLKLKENLNKLCKKSMAGPTNKQKAI